MQTTPVSRYTLSLPLCHMTSKGHSVNHSSKRRCHEFRKLGKWADWLPIQCQFWFSLQEAGSGSLYTGVQVVHRVSERVGVMVMQSVYMMCMSMTRGALQVAFFLKLLLQDALVLIKAAVDALHFARLAHPQLFTHQPDKALVVRDQHNATLRENAT